MLRYVKLFIIITMALQTFTWNNGTNAHPVELSPQQLSNLLKVATNNDIQSDVRGHITTSSGLIARYTKWQLEQKYGANLVIHATEEDDTFSIRPVRNAINEGEQSVITVTGMAVSSVKFRLQHSFRNVYGIQQSAAQARISMDGNTLMVDAPQENASWVDEVTIQAIPIYEEWSNTSAIQSCVVTITAKEITGIELTSPSLVVRGEDFESEVTLIPSTNTKGSHVTLDATCVSSGSLSVRKPSIQGLKVYTSAPAEDCSLTLTVDAYLFGDISTVAFTDTVSGIQAVHPYIKITATTDGTFTDISTANPKVKLQKVDSEGQAIGSEIELTGTVVGSSLVYTYQVLGNGTERYVVKFDDVYHYDEINNQTVIPNAAITEINVVYVYKKPKIYFANADGSRFEKLETALANGRVSIVAKYIVVYTEGEGETDPERCICFEMYPSYINNSNYSAQFMGSECSSGSCYNYVRDTMKMSQLYDNVYPTEALAKEDYDGYGNTRCLKNAIDEIAPRIHQQYSDISEESVTGPIWRQILPYLDTTFMGKAAKGYINSLGEILWWYSTMKDIEASLQSIGINITVSFFRTEDFRYPRFLISSTSNNSNNKVWMYGVQYLQDGVEDDGRVVSTSDVNVAGTKMSQGSDRQYTSILPLIHIDMDEFKARNEIGRPKLKVVITSNETDATKLANIMSQEITVTDENNVSTDLSNNGSITVAGDGSESYTISAPHVEGYILNYQASVTPNAYLTVVTIEYKKLNNGVYLVYSDGTYQSYEDYITTYQTLTGKTITALGVIGDNVTLLIDPTFTNNSSKKFIGGSNPQLRNFQHCAELLIEDSATAMLDFDGYANTKAFLLDLQNPNNAGITCPVKEDLDARHLIIGGIEKEWYLASLGEAVTIYNNLSALSQLAALFSGNPRPNYFEFGSGAGTAYGTSSMYRIESNAFKVHQIRPRDMTINTGYWVYSPPIIVYKP